MERTEVEWDELLWSIKSRIRHAKAKVEGKPHISSEQQNTLLKSIESPLIEEQPSIMTTEEIRKRSQNIRTTL